MAKRIVAKLVRDKILHNLHEQGKVVKYRHLEDDTEKKHKMIEKLGEKYKELFESLIRANGKDVDTDGITDNIADMLEVMNKIAKLRGINLTTVMERKKQKLDEKGGYDKWTYIHHIEE